MLLSHTWKGLASDFHQSSLSLCLLSLQSNGKRSCWLTVWARPWAKPFNACWLKTIVQLCVCSQSRTLREVVFFLVAPNSESYWNPCSSPPRTKLASIFRCGPNLNWHISFLLKLGVVSWVEFVWGLEDYRPLLLPQGLMLSWLTSNSLCSHWHTQFIQVPMIEARVLWKRGKHSSN